MSALPITRCKCGSLSCGPVRCRFDDPTSPTSKEEDDRFFRDEVDERLEELKEFDRHPERYR